MNNNNSVRIDRIRTAISTISARNSSGLEFLSLMADMTPQDLLDISEGKKVPSGEEIETLETMIEMDLM